MDQAIQDLEDKLKLLRENALKADPEETKDIEKEMDRIQRDLTALKAAKSKLGRELELLS